MDKNHEDSIKGAVIVKRSPSPRTTSAAQIIASTEEIRKSMKKNINILSKWIKESEEIMPRPKR